MKRIFDNAMWYVALAGAAVTPLIIAPQSEDRFRLPKELMLRAEGIVLIALALAALVWRAWPVRVRPRDPVLLLGAATVVWVAIATLVSSNRLLSTMALIRVICVVAFVLVVYLLAASRPLWAVAALLLPAIPNVIMVFLQERGIWNPFEFNIELTRHLQSTALIGNPNDAGGYLLVPALAAVTLVVAVRRHRAITIPLAAVLVGGLLMNQTLTAIAGFGAAIVTLAIVVSRRRWLMTGIVAATFLAVLLLYPPFRTRAVHIARFSAEGRFDEIVTGRTTAFLAAAEMAKQHPFFGVGPGCYRFEYYPYKLQVEDKHPKLLTSPGRTVNFGETHNDHLQVAAETGLPGYALLAAALVLLGIPSLKRTEGAAADARSRFATMLALPLAVSLFVLMLAQFPLQLAAPTMTYAFAAALCASWSRLPQ